MSRAAFFCWRPEDLRMCRIPDPWQSQSSLEERGDIAFGASACI
jgi:hypothetical protein